MARRLVEDLARLELQPHDVLLFKPPLGAADREFVGFIQEVHEQTGHVVIVVRPGFTLEALSDEDVVAAGMIRLFTNYMPGDDVDIQEDRAHQAVRQAYDRVRARIRAAEETHAARPSGNQIEASTGH